MQALKPKFFGWRMAGRQHFNHKCMQFLNLPWKKTVTVLTIQKRDPQIKQPFIRSSFQLKKGKINHYCQNGRDMCHMADQEVHKFMLLLILSPENISTQIVNSLYWWCQHSLSMKSAIKPISIGEPCFLIVHWHMMINCNLVYITADLLLIIHSIQSI